MEHCIKDLTGVGERELTRFEGPVERCIFILILAIPMQPPTPPLLSLSARLPNSRALFEPQLNSDFHSKVRFWLD